MRQDVVNADIERIRSALIGLAERFAAGERTELRPAIDNLREQLVRLRNEAPERFAANLDYLVERCEALARLVAN